MTATSTAVNITVDTAPTCSITSPANNTVFTAPASIAISRHRVEQHLHHQPGAVLRGRHADRHRHHLAAYGYTWNGVASGSYTLTVKATDALGLVTTSSAVTVISDNPPTCGITSPANNANIATGSNIPITASAASNSATISSVKFYQGATLLGTVTTSPYSYTWNSVAAGNYCAHRGRHRQLQPDGHLRARSISR